MLILAACNPSTTDSSSDTDSSSTTSEPSNSDEPSVSDPESTEHLATLTADNLGLPTEAYGDVASVTIDGLAIGVYQGFTSGFGIQMRYKEDGVKQSGIFNVAAAAFPIVSIELNYNVEKATTYAPTILDVYGATSALKDVHTGGTRLETTMSVYKYTIDFDVEEGITFFKVEKPALSYTAYIDSIVVTMLEVL